MMQRYRSHKEVHAGKIQGLHWKDSITGDPVLVGLTVGGQQYDVPENFGARGWPEVGDWFVKYDDNYVSWSPAAAFEAGYTLVEDNGATHKESVQG